MLRQDMHHSCQHLVPSRIKEAAFDPDFWTDVFRSLLLHAGENRAEIAFYRQPGCEPERAIAVRLRQEADASLPKAELVPFDGALAGTPAITFRLDEDSYGIHVSSTEPAAASLCQKIQEAEAEIINAVKFNRALLSSKTCFCGKRSVLSGLGDPVFRLALDGTIIWHNEIAAADSWQRVYSCDSGKPLTLRQASEQAAFRSALSELGATQDLSARILRITIPEEPHSAILALKLAQPCYIFTSPWVELFKPAPEAIAVIRRWDSKPNLSPSALRKFYGLTAKEAELAIALAQGVSLKDYAESKGVSFETARWHGKRVMQKMDCAKQQDVMYALLYRNALFSILD